MGSAGRDFAATYGGGTVVISLKRLELNGYISANGFPNESSSVGTFLAHGGSGGYIFLNFTDPTLSEVKFGSSAAIRAVGGLGINNGFSGSGGRVVM